MTLNCIRSKYRKAEFVKRADIEDEAIDWESSARTLTGEQVLDERFEEMVDSQVDFNNIRCGSDLPVYI